MRRITVHAASLHDTVLWVAFCLTPSLIQHPNRSVCRSAVTTLPSLTSQSHRLTDWLPASSAPCTLGQNISSRSLLLTSVFDVLHSSAVVLLPFVAALCRRSAAGPVIYHSPPPLCWLPVYPPVRPSGSSLWRYDLCQSLPKFNPFPFKLTSPFLHLRILPLEADPSCVDTLEVLPGCCCQFFFFFF